MLILIKTECTIISKIRNYLNKGSKMLSVGTGGTASPRPFCRLRDISPIRGITSTILVLRDANATILVHNFNFSPERN